MRIIMSLVTALLLMVSLAACGGDTSPKGKVAKIQQLIENKKYESALEKARALMPEMPTDSALLMATAKAYQGLDKADSAHSYAKKFTALYPMRLDGYQLLYATGEEVLDYDAQIWAVSQLGYLENNRRKYHQQIAELNFLRGEYGMAMKTCEMILEYDPGNSRALFVLANSLAAANQIDSAIAIMEQLNFKNPDKVEILSNLASFFVSKRDFDKAAIHFKRLTTIYPDYMPGWFGLGNVLLSRGDTLEAMRAYEQVWERDSTFLNVDSIMHELNRLKPMDIKQIGN